jgi:hypothetical protein
VLLVEDGVEQLPEPVATSHTDQSAVRGPSTA